MTKTLLALFFTLCCIFSYSQSKEKLFEDSYDLLDGMLHAQPYSFRKAVFSVENAYLDGNLDTVSVNKQIRLLRNLSETLTNERSILYAEKDKAIVNKWAAIFEVICDTIPVVMEGREYKYLPFGYDFSDAFGHADWSNMFVSKLLLTRKGNCHSLPYLYKILAEEMGVEANLALAPNHIYIKHKSLKDGWYNTELTSGIFPIDAWLMASGYVHIDAIANGVYMKALNDKENIALVMIDLAQAYQKRFPDSDGSFILKCCDSAILAYPNFAAALILKAETHKTAFERQKNEMKADALFEELAKEYAYIHQLGYRNMPEAMYLNWLSSLQAERDKYENKKLSNFNK